MIEFVPLKIILLPAVTLLAFTQIWFAPLAQKEVPEMDTRMSVTDLMIIADIEGEPRFAWREGEDQPYSSNDRFVVSEGDTFIVEYDDGVKFGQFRITVRDGNSEIVDLDVQK